MGDRRGWQWLSQVAHDIHATERLYLVEDLVRHALEDRPEPVQSAVCEPLAAHTAQAGVFRAIFHQHHAFEEAHEVAGDLALPRR
ncbi:hypothetical protein WME73_15170 [Sorangium sp. So ce302]